MIIIRETVEEDIENIYMHLNQNFVKKYYKNQEEEQKRNHERWYSFLIGSPNYIMYTVENLKKEFLGIVKFKLDMELNLAEISLYLSPKIRGKGYSTKILEVAIEEVKERCFELQYIVGYILEENQNSINCFKKLGFVFEEKSDCNGIEYLLFVKNLK